jgi:amino acid permease
VVSLLGIFFLLLSILVIIGYGIYEYGGEINDPIQSVMMFPNSFSNVMRYIGVATFCYGQCSIIFPIEESMADKKQIKSAIFWCLLIVWVI